MIKTLLAGGFLFLTAAASASECGRMAPAVLSCYHPTAHYTGCVDHPSHVVTILFSGGITGRPYQMDVAFERREDFARFTPISDNAIMPPNNKCPLSQWQPVRD